jgi:hypothetical protein
MQIEHGDTVAARTADDDERHLRALGEVVAGGDFAVVWVCSEAEWDAAVAEGRDPEGIPWPAEDVKAVSREAMPA